MSDLISKDELLKYANGEITSAFVYPQGQRADDEKAYREMWTNIRNILLSAPIVDAEPIKHGRWELVEDDIVGLIAKCSVCGEKTYNAVSWDFKGNERRYLYCPKCGAKMDEAEE